MPVLVAVTEHECVGMCMCLRGVLVGIMCASAYLSLFCEVFLSACMGV